jgi:hypothetical protein
MSAYKLVLHPLPAAARPRSLDALLAALHGMGFLGPAFELDGRRHFQTGPCFLDHLTFLGCSPVVELDPPADDRDAHARAGRFCHVELRPPTAAPRLRGGTDPPPRCRQCRRPVEPALLAAAAVQSGTLSCPVCGCRSDLERLNWRQAGGYACVFLDIWGIHPAEAVPGDALLETLARFTDSSWGFFYSED